MVYCGKPSRGCKTCKDRHIKCDETRPHCLNCRKKKRECPGYPQEIDLVFRDQTTAVVKRLKKSSTPRKLSWNEKENAERGPDALHRHDSPDKGQVRLSSLEPHDFSGSPTSLDLNAQCVLLPPVEVQTTSYLFRNFSLPTRSLDTSRGVLNAAAAHYFDPACSQQVRLTTHAVALAIIGCRDKDMQTVRRADLLYGKAMVATQQALQDPLQGTSDATLIATLLLTFYEAITPSHHSATAWRQHGYGAAAIVRARGLDQLKDPFSAGLFRTARTHVVSTSIHTVEYVPEFPGPKGWLSDMNVKDGAAIAVESCFDVDKGDFDSATSELTSIAIALPNLLCQMKALTDSSDSPSNRAALEEALRKAQYMERKQLHWERHMPKQWAYRSPAAMLGVVHEDNVDESECWPGPLHAYDDIHTASIRNTNRVHQAICSNAIMSAIAWLKPANYLTDEAYNFSKNRVQDLVDDVCSSVPFHIWGQDLGGLARPERQNPRAAGGMGRYFLIWPLYSCSILECIPRLQRRWLLGRLRDAATITNISQATVLEAASREILENQHMQAKYPR